MVQIRVNKATFLAPRIVVPPRIGEEWSLGGDIRFVDGLVRWTHGNNQISGITIDVRSDDLDFFAATAGNHIEPVP
jgi:hypothetical protein